MYDFNWRKQLSHDLEDRRANCWISPNGEWYNVSPTEHEEFAVMVCKDIYGEELDYRKAGEILKWRHEWIYVSSNYYEGTHVHGSKHMSPDQYMLLKEYWGDTLLFRMWTIQRMWEESKYHPDNEGST
jgi:hypothetical protein